LYGVSPVAMLLILVKGGNKMFEVGDYVIYRRSVCKIKELKKKYLNNSDYYIIVPVDDESLIIEVPINNANGYLKNIIDKKELERIVNEIPNIKEIGDTIGNIENEYKQLLNSGEHEDLVKIIKTTYLRNKERQQAGKKIAEKDNNYYKMAEKRLYSEFSIVLNMDYDDTRDYVIKRVESIENK